MIKLEEIAKLRDNMFSGLSSLKAPGTTSTTRETTVKELEDITLRLLTELEAQVEWNSLPLEERSYLLRLQEHDLRRSKPKHNASAVELSETQNSLFSKGYLKRDGSSWLSFTEKGKKLLKFTGAPES